MAVNHDGGDSEPAPQQEPVWAELQIKRGPNGKVMLYVDAKQLHERLLSMGAMVDSAGRFLDQPPSTHAEAGTDRTQLMPCVFLKQEYPAAWPIASAWQSPPSMQRLADVCATAEHVVKQILGHYAPVDIRLKIRKG